MEDETVWLVRAIACYPRKGKSNGKSFPTPPRRWCADTTRAGYVRNLEIPVIAESKGDAEQKALDSVYVEELRDIPTTRMETL